VFKSGSGCKQTRDFLDAEDDRQLLDLWTRWYLKTCFIPLADVSVEVDNAREVIVAGSPRHLPFIDQIDKVSLNLLVCQCARRLAAVSSQVRNSSKIILFRVIRETLNGHVVQKLGP